MHGYHEFGSLAEHGSDSGSEPEVSEYLTGTDEDFSSEGQPTTRLKSVVVPVQNSGGRNNTSGSCDRSCLLGCSFVRDKYADHSTRTQQQ